MLEGVHCFASAAEDGSLHIIRVHISQTAPLPKYGKVQAIREHRVDAPGEYITCMHHYNTGKLQWTARGCGTDTPLSRSGV